MDTRENKLWIVTSCRKKCDANGPMTSILGSKFMQYLLSSGLSRSQIHFDYIVDQVPNKGGIENFPPHVVAQGAQELKERIKQYKPNVIFCLGAEPLSHFLNASGLLKWRGHVFWLEDLQTKFMCTFEPYHAYRQANVSIRESGAQKPGQYEMLMINDINRAVEESQVVGLSQAMPDYKLQPTYAEVISAIKNMQENAKIVSFDIEIIKPYSAHLMDCIGLSSSPDSAICIPFYMPNKEGYTPYWKNRNEHLHIMQELKALMESPIPKVAQNSQFDMTVLSAYYDIHVENLVWDTMVVAHEIYCDLPKDLGTLISLYTRLPQHKALIHTGSLMDRWEYNAADAVANIHVMLGQQEEMCVLEGVEDYHDTTYYKHYTTITHPSIGTCIRMHKDGVLIDEGLRQRVLSRQQTAMDFLYAIVDDIFPIYIDQGKKAAHKWNLNSADQKKLMFYDLLGCPTQYHNKAITVNKIAMQAFTELKCPVASTLARLCLEYRKADATLGKFKIQPDGNIIRSKYDVCGTDTGRLSSSENKEEDGAMKMTKNPILPAETNLQNIKKGPARRMFLPRNGEEFCLVDLYSAEAYLTALDAGELDLLRILDAGKKPYTILLDKTKEVFPNEVELASYGYKQAKQSVHACNYGVEPWKMHVESGLPLHVCDWQHAWYHGKYPGIRERMKRVKHTVDTTRWLTSPLGRKRYFVQPQGKERDNVAYAWPSQSAIGEIAKIGMNALYAISLRHEIGDASLPWCLPNMNTHDGLAIRCDRDTREEVAFHVRNAFNVPLTLRGITIRIPLEIGWGENFNDMKDETVHFYKGVTK